MDRLHVIDKGQGPAVLFIHGVPMSAELLEPLATLLADEFRVLIPDLPGSGRSPELAGEHSNERMERLLEHCLTERGVVEAAIVGTSLGGYRGLSMAIAGRFPVRAVVTLAGYAAYDDERRQLMAGFAEAVPEADLGTDQWRQVMQERMLAPAFAGSHPQEAAAVHRWLFSTSKTAMAAELRCVAENRDLTGELPGLDIPVTAIVGELDLATPVADSEHLRQQVAGATVHVLPGAGHAIWVERPQEVAELTRAGLRKGWAGRAG